MSRRTGGEGARGGGRLRLRVASACLALAAGVSAGDEGTPGGAARFPLQFDSETVRLFVEPESLRVEGLYVFRCPGTALPEVSLLYPYPAGELAGGARTLRLEGRSPGGTWRPLDFREMPGRSAVRWRIPLDLGDPFEVRTTYRQELRAQRARYLVTTARAWGVPLRRARFEIRLPPGAVPTRFSLPFERRESGGDVIYLHEAEEFAPLEDVIVEWEMPRGGDPGDG